MARSSFPSDDIDKLLVRFPEGMRDRIKVSAENLGRSMNAEIIQRLKRSLADDEDDRIKVALPADVWNALMSDAHIHDLQMDERAAQIITNAYDSNADLTIALEKVRNLTNEVNELSEKIEEYRSLLIESINNRKGTTALFKSVCHHILSYSEGIPSELSQLAEEMLSIFNEELGDITKDISK